MFPVRPDPADRIGIAIMARAPVPGQTKTRLIPRLGPVGAARLQGWLLQRTVATAVVADVGPVSLWCAPDMRHPDFRLCRAFGPVTLHRQPEGDLGARMRAAVAASPTAGGTLVIGTDCPALTPTLLQRAADRLRHGDDAVLIPAEDGGYVLIGMREGATELFADIPWGTDAVSTRTRERLATLNWRWSEPAALWDVDRPGDLDRLARCFPDAPIPRAVAA
jgi:rSAM/selenodomain-associated transferase 1